MATELTKEQFIETFPPDGNVDNNPIEWKALQIFTAVYLCEDHKAYAREITGLFYRFKKNVPKNFGDKKIQNNLLNIELVRLAKRIEKKYKLGFIPETNQDEKFWYWDLFFNYWQEEESKFWVWQLKPNLAEAIKILFTDYSRTWHPNLIERIREEILANKTIDQIHKEFEEKVKSSKNDSQQERQERLKSADKKPTSTSAQINVFLRNPDVRVEVLHRAGGHCEYCQCPAPFKKDSDGEGFFEVHHIIPLAERGDDTVENAVALCPNCHRHAHYGKDSFDIGRLK